MTEVYHLKHALMIYAGDQHYFQIHDVFPDAAGANKPPVLGAGRPLTREALEVICRAVLPTMIGHLAYLDGRVLASSGTIHGPDIWWVPPKVRPIFFGGQIKIKEGLAPWPGLIFAAHRQELSLWAVKGNKRPLPETKVYIAPFFNMTDKSICLGSAKKPEKSNDYGAWEKALFQSAFSEERKESRVSDGQPLTLFWKELMGSKAKTFPEDRLLPSKTPKTVKELIERYKGEKQ